MDGSMPVMDGITAARHIRRHELDTNAPRTPIVGLTAHVVGIDAQQWRDAGMDAVVYKPFTLTQLSQSIETLLPQLARHEKETDEPDRKAAADGMSALPEERGEILDYEVFGRLIETQKGGQSDFAERIVHLYAENAPLAITQIEEAAAKRDFEGCARAAHSLKSMSFSIGASRVARHANDLEVLSREGRVPVAAADIATLKASLSEVRLEIELRMRGDDQRNSSLTVSVNRAPDLENERALQRGLEQQQFSLLYQPIVDRAGRMVGVEALLRWSPEPGKQISPTVFIPIAEKTGVIHDLGNWAMRRAFDDGKAWPGIDISVNVSPVQLMQSDFAGRVERAISMSGFDPGRVVLEITESTLLSAENTVDALIDHLRQFNIRFALDDFGTGYASLTSLRHYPFDRIKIDRSFVSNLQTTADATIVHAVIAIAKSLGLNVVAEGVEQPEQRKFLTSAGVNFFQGYLFGRPMPKEDISARLFPERATNGLAM
jgi:EAL domain-containing protein (putative c-di-GMP-specific phosphodiesterase class I)